MGIFTDAFKGFMNSYPVAKADETYQAFVPHSFGTYARAGLWATGKVLAGLGKKAISGLWIGGKALVFSAPAACKSAWSGIKATTGVVNLARTWLNKQYQAYRDDPEDAQGDALYDACDEYDAAYEQFKDAVSDTCSQGVEALYTLGSTAYNAESVFPEVSVSSLAGDCAEALSNGFKAGVVLGVETAKAVKNSSITDQFANAVSEAERLTAETAQSAYHAARANFSYLPRFEAANEAGHLAQTTLKNGVAAAFTAFKAATHAL